MVNIAKRDFNKDLGSYIDKRRKGSGLGLSFKLPFKKKSKGVDEVVPDIGPTEVHVEYKEPGKLAKLFSFRKKLIKETALTEDLTPEEMARLRGMEDDIEDTEKMIVEKEDEIREIRDEEEGLVERREGLLKGFFSKINVFKRRPMETVKLPDEYAEEGPALDTDVVEVLKVMHRWIEQLTPVKRRSFKASKDFKKYKAVLEKYGLIRK